MNYLLNKTIFLITLILLFVGLILPRSAFSQEQYSFANAYQIADSEAAVGDIISQNQDGEYVRSTLETSQHLIGVFADTPSVYYEPIEGTGSPIVTTGTFSVNVSTLNGAISPGDFIVASDLPGVGQRGGNMLNLVSVGTALESFSEEDGSPQTINDQEVFVGSVDVLIQVGPIGQTQAGALTNLIDQLSNLLFQSAQTPQQAEVLFRYLAAAIVAAVAIGVSFRTFGNSVRNGIEAMGRNPLARREIQLTIIINAGLIALISVGGIILSLVILRV